MCVDLSRADVAVAEHFLDGAQVGPVLQKMGGKGVAEYVWSDRGQPFLQCVGLNEPEESIAAEPAPVF